MNSQWTRRPLPRLCFLFSLCALLCICSACSSGILAPTTRATPVPLQRQVLILPEVGVQDLSSLDPVRETGLHATLVMNMLYSGLVRLDQNLRVQPDQATWSVSNDRKVYTFHLRSHIAFSDGTPITAQTYEYTLARALQPALESHDAELFLGAIVGAQAVRSGKSTTLSGVHAVDASTLVITLTRPAEYFLQALANPLAFPVNAKVVKQYGETDWSEHAAGHAVGSGPFLLKQWEHSAKMLLLPNPYYYGNAPRLAQVEVIFVADAHRAFQTYQGGQYSLVWNMLPSDRGAAEGLSGFVSQPLLQTDTLFFNVQMPPFDHKEVRQAFAYAIDDEKLVSAAFGSSALPASSLVPPEVPGYQSRPDSLSFNPAQALAALQSVYPNMDHFPTVTFAYPASLVPNGLADTLQKMWETNLGITVNMLPVESNAYSIERSNHQIQLGFAQESINLPDPYAFLSPSLASGGDSNYGDWTDSAFDSLISQAEQVTDAGRLELYAQAEQLALDEVARFPLDRQTLSAIIPATVHGVSLNALGLFFGDWSNVYLVSNAGS